MTLSFRICDFDKSWPVRLHTHYLYTIHRMKWIINTYWSSHRRYSVRNFFFRNFAKFTGKHLCESLFFNKVAGLSLQKSLKKGLSHWCFPVNFTKFLRIPFLQNTSGRLLLYILRAHSEPCHTLRCSLLWKLLIAFNAPSKMFHMGLNTHLILMTVYYSVLLQVLSWCRYFSF